ncbi:sigma factor sigB regulation protein rsbU [Propionigenium maris DSM 9537]|uniref:Sigma factor sigB regulation protein rsbU n=1 Tax=Propionigenium maris DSM 9537 TaxID=1123000 RepID=A0A9W6GK92_9FUSO|nr:PP2C family protein-serine/threonine phosphatase [Propionigenium maris]GLI55485.1 sigma factor sigB regulation protein rsbU [Propionigenium maris DSM 9537]
MLFVLVTFTWIVILGVVAGKIHQRYNNEMLTMLKRLRDKEELEHGSEEVQEEYESTLDQIRKQDRELENSIDELREYRKELDITYDTLIKKSTQLEYSNQILEKRVANLSNLNAVARTVLSIIELERIIDIILDAYFVLTGAKKISLYLWEEGELVNKKTKGNIMFKGNLSYPQETLEKFNREDYRNIYEDLSKGFKVDAEETVIISDLNVKGKELGVIYIIEDKQKLVDSDEETISALAIQVASAINNAQIYAELLVKERLSQELEVASRIQKRILPKEINKVFGLEIANYFEPAKEVGGDYYDYCVRDDNRVSVTIADVSGKGVPAAFLMALIRSVLKTLNIKDIYPSEMLTDLNDIIYPDITEDMFVTLFHSKYEYSTRTLYYSNAGHNPLIVYKADEGRVVEHNVKGVAIGFVPNYQYKLGEVKLSKGDVLLYYTDGITEAENSSRDMFGIDRLKNVILENKDRNAEEIKAAILEAVNVFRGDYEQVDDLTFVVLKNTE